MTTIKDYFTTEDFVFTMQMLLNERWTEDEAEQTLYCLLEEGKVQETELGIGKFEPTEELLLSNRGGA